MSHHLRILKKAGIVAMRREGTKNYYYLSTEATNRTKIADLVDLICDSIKRLDCS